MNEATNTVGVICDKSHIWIRKLLKAACVVVANKSLWREVPAVKSAGAAHPVGRNMSGRREPLPITTKDTPPVGPKTIFTFFECTLIIWPFIARNSSLYCAHFTKSARICTWGFHVMNKDGKIP